MLNSLMEITRPASSVGIPGLYVTDNLEAGVPNKFVIDLHGLVPKTV